MCIKDPDWTKRLPEKRTNRTAWLVGILSCVFVGFVLNDGDDVWPRRDGEEETDGREEGGPWEVK